MGTEVQDHFCEGVVLLLFLDFVWLLPLVLYLEHFRNCVKVLNLKFSATNLNVDISFHVELVSAYMARKKMDSLV